ELRARVRALMATHSLDALIYPTWDNPPRLIGDLNTPHGNNSQQLSPPTGFPAITGLIPPKGTMDPPRGPALHHISPIKPSSTTFLI
ncbi:MAG: hypothetical protein CFH05_01562, partial [Alphaproteobacteria bacterium MarineAlpha3_Bin4]